MDQPVNMAKLMADIMADIMALSIPDRILLVQDIWDSVADEPEAFPPFTQAQPDEFDRRIDAHEADPEAGSSWEEVRARIQRRERT